MIYATDNTHYEETKYHAAEFSGANLPAISLGLWKTWGQDFDFNMNRSMLRTAFDLRITHFNLTNNHSNPAESAIQNFGNDVAVDYHMHPDLFETSTVAAEQNFGKIFQLDFKAHRDEMLVSITAGGDNGFSTYGDHGSQDYLVASIDQSLQRMGLEYVDIFYHHSPSRATPLEETMHALKHIVDSGKALHIGFSHYSPRQIFEAAKVLEDLGTPCVTHQFDYDIFDASIENSALASIGAMGMESMIYSAFLQDMLVKRGSGDLGFVSGNTNIYQKSVSHRNSPALENQKRKFSELRNLAMQRGKSAAMLMLTWMRRKKSITSTLLEATSQAQIQEAAQVLALEDFSENDLNRVDQILTGDHNR